MLALWVGSISSIAFLGRLALPWPLPFPPWIPCHCSWLKPWCFADQSVPLLFSWALLFLVPLVHTVFPLLNFSVEPLGEILAVPSTRPRPALTLLRFDGGGGRFLLVDVVVMNDDIVVVDELTLSMVLT